MTRLIARDQSNNCVKTWGISERIETQLHSLKAKVESIGIPFSIPILLTAKDALNQKIEQDISSLYLTSQQLQDIAQFSKICQEISQLSQNETITLLIER